MRLLVVVDGEQLGFAAALRLGVAHDRRPEKHPTLPCHPTTAPSEGFFSSSSRSRPRHTCWCVRDESMPIHDVQPMKCTHAISELLWPIKRLPVLLPHLYRHQ
jgi:hypothetical protein